MIRKEYTADLEKLKVDVLKMGELSKESAKNAIHALVHRDMELAANILKENVIIDNLEFEIEHLNYLKDCSGDHSCEKGILELNLGIWHKNKNEREHQPNSAIRQEVQQDRYERPDVLKYPKLLYRGLKLAADKNGYATSHNQKERTYENHRKIIAYLCSETS